MAAFFTGLISTALTVGATASAATVGTVGAVTSAVTGIAGLLSAFRVGFFAALDVKDANSMKEVKKLTETIHDETSPRQGNRAN